jgi:hypothetical protein
MLPFYKTVQVAQFCKHVWYINRHIASTKRYFGMDTDFPADVFHIWVQPEFFAP